MNLPHILLSVVFLRDGDEWVVQALERDFAAHGKTREEALKALAGVVLGHLKLTKGDPGGPLVDVPPAPERFWKIWNLYTETVVRPLVGPDAGVPPAYIIQAVTTGLAESSPA